METTPPSSASRSARRSLVLASLIALFAGVASAGGCSNQPPGPEFLLEDTAAAGGTQGTVSTGSPPGNMSTSAAATTSAMGSASTGTTGSGMGAGTVGAGSVGTGNVGAGNMGVGGGDVGSPVTGNMSTGTMSTGTMGSVTSSTTGVVEEVCEDVQPPPDPEWPGAVCENWANETTACGEEWFADYCDISCGRCIPEGGSPLPMAPDCSGEGLPNVTGGEGFATRYWDCCQPHCSQFDGHRCGQDGTTRTGDSNSACNGGGSFACYDEAPRAISECLAYGHIAKANPNCGGCYRIQFTGQGEHNANDIGSRLIKGKQMIVKVTNTGGDVAGNQFDLMIPGGGVGMFNACSRQWNQSDLGAQYGGFLTECTGTHEQKKECVRQECMKIPAGQAREGCIWFVDWFQVADNPKFTSTPTDCPF